MAAVGGGLQPSSPCPSPSPTHTPPSLSPNKQPLQHSHSLPHDADGQLLSPSSPSLDPRAPGFYHRSKSASGLSAMRGSPDRVWYGDGEFQTSPPRYGPAQAEALGSGARRGSWTGPSAGQDLLELKGLGFTDDDLLLAEATAPKPVGPTLGRRPSMPARVRFAPDVPEGDEEGEEGGGVFGDSPTNSREVCRPPMSVSRAASTGLPYAMGALNLGLDSLNISPYTSGGFPTSSSAMHSMF